MRTRVQGTRTRQQYMHEDKGARQQDKGARQQDKGARQQDKGARQQDKTDYAAGLRPQEGADLHELHFEGYQHECGLNIGIATS